MSKRSAALARLALDCDPSILRRFNEKIEKANGAGCWNWTGALNDGYGSFCAYGGVNAAHRVAVVLSGRSIPADMVVDHICRNRKCVNPEHLRIVDNYTNLHENSMAAAHVFGTATHCIRGHPFDEENTVVSKVGYRSCRECNRARDRRRYRRMVEETGIGRGGNQSKRLREIGNRA